MIIIIIIIIIMIIINVDILESGDAPPKTFSMKDKFEYFKPSVQVEMEDKHDIVTEIFVRGTNKCFCLYCEIIFICWTF